jgi:UPF0176 protein
MHILNIAGYKFIALSDLSGLRQSLQDEVNLSRLKGTILLSDEGINFSLAGLPDDVDTFMRNLKKEPLFADITFRKSYSDFIPFKHMRVKIRKEIITLRKPDIHPENCPAPDISPTELRRWLDEKRDITLLDTRNEYEVRFGTFENATQLGIDDFGEFPSVIDQIPRDKPVVMFCTGGIRCEKAALVMMDAGYSNIYQLKGGILNYFAEVGATHYNGECFVFDERIAVDASLKPTGTMQCLTCEGPVTTACAQCESL